MSSVIKTLYDKVRVRSTPEFTQPPNKNLLRWIKKRGTEVLAVNVLATTEGLWWILVEGGYVHESVVKELAESIVTSFKVLAEPPYRSQWDPDANGDPSDCGPACVGMFASWYGIKVHINDLPYRSQKGYTNGAQLVKNGKKIGLPLKTMVVSDIADIPLPAIWLMYYGGFGREHVEDKGLRGWHWLVVLQWMEDDVRVHDPNWGLGGINRRGGENKIYPKEDAQRAFIPEPESGKYIAVVEANP